MKILTLNINRNQTLIQDALKQYKQYDILNQETKHITKNQLEQLEKIFNIHTNHSRPINPNHAGTLTAIKKSDNIINITNVNEHIDDKLQGRLSNTKFEYNNTTIYMINIYATCSEPGKYHFYKSLEKYLKNTKEENIILAGDFNLTYNDIDRNAHCKAKNIKHTQEILVNIIKLNKLSDTFRIKYPKNKLYTYFQNLSAQRLDRIYVSQGLNTRIKKHKN